MQEGGHPEHRPRLLPLRCRVVEGSRGPRSGRAMTPVEEWLANINKGLLDPLVIFEYDLRRIASLVALYEFGVDPLPEGRLPN